MNILLKPPFSFARRLKIQLSAFTIRSQKRAEMAASKAWPPDSPPGSGKVIKTEALAPKDEYEDFFSYTSGRWLYDEQAQKRKRYIRFDVQALQQVATQALGSRCTEIRKLPEGLYNKVLSLRMENGKEILARIPNPNAGHPHYVVASEVATLDFVCILIHPSCSSGLSEL